LQALSPARRRSRLWLYLPFVLLALIVVAWSAGWFVVRGRIEAGLDTWLQDEAKAGRLWTCPDRSVAGFPFRIEISCASLAFARSDLQASTGRLLVVAQVYDPQHVIAEVAGPLRVTTPNAAIDAQWQSLQTSVHMAGTRPERGDLVATKPVIAVTGVLADPVNVTAARLEAHVRPSPAESSAADAALQLAGATIPGLDGLIGGTEPADLDLLATITQARNLPPRPMAAELERWRAAGGEVKVARLTIQKGPRRIEANGGVSIDELHRVQGISNAATTGIEGLLGQFVGGRRGGAAGLLSALLGAPPAQAPVPSANGGPALTPAPPLRAQNGRVFFGPLQIPGVHLPPLY
jgi:hypothetical protein